MKTNLVPYYMHYECARIQSGLLRPLAVLFKAGVISTSMNQTREYDLRQAQDLSQYSFFYYYNSNDNYSI